MKSLFYIFSMFFFSFKEIQNRFQDGSIHENFPHFFFHIFQYDINNTTHTRKHTTHTSITCAHGCFINIQIFFKKMYLLKYEKS